MELGGRASKILALFLKSRLLPLISPVRDLLLTIQNTEARVVSRAVKVSALIDAINVAAINALKYFNAINATLFTSGVRCPLTTTRSFFSYL